MLNRAHYLERQAEKAARKGRIEEAIQLHKEAADILRDLLQSVRSFVEFRINVSSYIVNCS